MISDKELQESQSRVDAASPGPWTSLIEGRDFTAGSSFIMIGEGENRKDDIEMLAGSDADQDFMAAARQDIPKLLAEVLRLKKLVKEMYDR